MIAELLFWHKARLQERYILEMAIHRVKRSTRYPEGLKYGLILIDLETDAKDIIFISMTKKFLIVL